MKDLIFHFKVSICVYSMLVHGNPAIILQIGLKLKYKENTRLYNIINN